MRALINLAERTGMTYLEAFITLLLAAGSLNWSIVQVAGVAAIPAGLTVVAVGVPQVGEGLPFAIDLVLRSVRTFVVTFLGFLIAMPVFSFDWTAWKAAAIAAVPAALAVAKGLLASTVGNKTAALLPASLEAS